PCRNRSSDAARPVADPAKAETTVRSHGRVQPAPFDAGVLTCTRTVTASGCIRDTCVALVRQWPLRRAIMQTRLTDWARNADYGSEADGILRRCTHCGFCLATCPTFLLTGDELDSPRGRIYQMKLVLEGEQPTHETLLHLDRCLTCNNCETTCPSGVE